MFQNAKRSLFTANDDIFMNAEDINLDSDYESLHKDSVDEGVLPLDVSYTIL